SGISNHLCFQGTHSAPRVYLFHRRLTVHGYFGGGLSASRQLLEFVVKRVRYLSRCRCERSFEFFALTSLFDAYVIGANVGPTTGSLSGCVDDDQAAV